MLEKTHNVFTNSKVPTKINKKNIHQTNGFAENKKCVYKKSRFWSEKDKICLKFLSKHWNIKIKKSHKIIPDN